MRFRGENREVLSSIFPHETSLIGWPGLELLQREVDGRLQPLGLGAEGRSARSRQAIIPPALVVQIGIRPPRRLLDEALVLEAANGRVDRCRPELDGSGRLLLDGFANEVPVSVVDGEREQNLIAGRRQRPGRWRFGHDLEY